MLPDKPGTTTTTVHEQHASQVTDSRCHRKILEKIQQTNYASIIYDTEWKDENEIKPISNEFRTSIQNARYRYPRNVQYEQAEISLSTPILSRERFEHIENNNYETTQQIQNDEKQISNLKPNHQYTEEFVQIERFTDDQQVLCRPIDDHLHINDEHASTLSEDSLFIYHQQQPNIKSNESKILENPLCSTAFLTLNYAHHNQEKDSSWRQLSDLSSTDQYQQEKQSIQYQIEKPSELLDSSVLNQNQPELRINFDDQSILESILRSSSTLPVNYAHQNQETDPFFQQLIDEQFSNEYKYSQQYAPSQTDSTIVIRDPSELPLRLNEPTHSIRFTDLLTLNYAQHNLEQNSFFQQAIDQQFSNQYKRLEQHAETQIEKLSELSDGALLIRHQPETYINLIEPTFVEHTLRSTTLLPLNHPQECKPWRQQAIDQQIFDQYYYAEQHARFHPEQPTPRYLPVTFSTTNEQLLEKSENYINEFHQAPLLHENVRIQTSDTIPLVSSTQITQSKPIYRVRQQPILTNEYDYSILSPFHSDYTDQVNTNQVNMQLTDQLHLESPPPTINTDIRIRPTHSDTSSPLNIESFLNHFEEHLESEQHLPIAKYIPLSNMTSLPSFQADTQRAIERYEKAHPFFSRSLPIEWIEPKILPHDEQLVDQWTIERNIETIQQQVESRTNTECSSVVVVAATAAADPDAISNDAYSVGERFEEEESNSLNTKSTNSERTNNQIAVPIIVSHCSPTSDYETDSLDKDNDTTSTTTSIGTGFLFTATPVMATLPSQSSGTVPVVSVDYLLDALVNEQQDKTDNITKDFLLTIGFGQRHKTIHHAKENVLEHDNNILINNFSESQQELLDIFFEPAHFRLPIINEISIYQINFHNKYSIFSSSNFLLPIIHQDDNISSNKYKSNRQEILSIAQLNHQSDNEENFESISCKYEQPSYVEHYRIQPLNPFSETLYVHIDEPPNIIDNEDDHSTSSILPDVIPSTTVTIQNEVIHTNTIITKREAYIACLSIQSVK